MSKLELMMTIVKEEASNAKKQSELHKYQQAMMRRADTRAGAETRTYNEGAHADMHEKIRLSRRIFETTMDRAAKAEQHETFVQQVQAMEDKTRLAQRLSDLQAVSKVREDTYAMHYALASGLEEDQTRWELQKRLAELSMSHLDEVDKIREGRGACSLDTGLARNVAKSVAYAGLALEARACFGQAAKDELQKDLPAVTSNHPEPDTMQDEQYYFADETLRAAIRAGSDFV